MPGHRVYIETNRDGAPVFIRRRPSSYKSNSSNSSGSSRYQASMSSERVHILHEELERLRERERNLTQSYDHVCRQNEIQKMEAQRMQRTMAEQNASIHRLQHEMSNFRKESDIATDNASRYQTKYREMKIKNEDLARQNDSLGAKIRGLTHQLHVDADRRVHSLREQNEELQRNNDSKDRMLARMRKNLNDRIVDCDDLKSDNTALRKETDILRNSLETAKRVLSRHGIYV